MLWSKEDQGIIVVQGDLEFARKCAISAYNLALKDKASSFTFGGPNGVVIGGATYIYLRTKKDKLAVAHRLRIPQYAIDAAAKFIKLIGVLIGVRSLSVITYTHISSSRPRDL
jgi:hypothetical protein